MNSDFLLFFELLMSITVSIAVLRSIGNRLGRFVAIPGKAGEAS